MSQKVPLSPTGVRITQWCPRSKSQNSWGTRARVTIPAGNAVLGSSSSYVLALEVVPTSPCSRDVPKSPCSWNSLQDSRVPWRCPCCPAGCPSGSRHRVLSLHNPRESRRSLFRARCPGAPPVAFPTIPNVPGTSQVPLLYGNIPGSPLSHQRTLLLPGFASLLGTPGAVRCLSRGSGAG